MSELHLNDFNGRRRRKLFLDTPVALHTLPLSVSRWVGRVLDQRSFEACKLVNDVYQDNNENTDHDEGRGGIV